VIYHKITGTAVQNRSIANPKRKLQRGSDYCEKFIVGDLAAKFSQFRTSDAFNEQVPMRDLNQNARFATLAEQIHQCGLKIAVLQRKLSRKSLGEELIGCVSEIKVNSYCSFPQMLDVARYLTEGHDHAGSTVYELFGVLVRGRRTKWPLMA
jgi:hypothetical protein